MKHFITLFLLSSIVHSITPCGPAQAAPTETRYQTPPRRPMLESDIHVYELGSIHTNNPELDQRIQREMRSRIRAQHDAAYPVPTVHLTASSAVVAAAAVLSLQHDDRS